MVLYDKKVQGVDNVYIKNVPNKREKKYRVPTMSIIYEYNDL